MYVAEIPISSRHLTISTQCEPAVAVSFKPACHELLTNQISGKGHHSFHRPHVCSCFK